jgi:hypothetical protein
VAVSGHLPRGPGPQRRDRHRPGIVRVVLVHIAGLQQPHPRRQLGLDVQHLLARGGQLLRQQTAQPGGTLDRPGALRPYRRPRQQLPGLARAGADLLPAQRLLGRADRHRCMRPLVRVNPDHHSHRHTPRSSRQTRATAAGMPYTRPVMDARPSFEPRHGEVRRGRHIDLKPGTHEPAGGSGASPVEPHRTLRQTAAPSRTVSIRRLGARLSRALRTVGKPRPGGAARGEIVFLCIASARGERARKRCHYLRWVAVCVPPVA